MIKLFKITFLIFVMTYQIGLSQTTLNLKSPDSKINLRINLKDGALYYDVKINEKVFLESSPLGLKTSVGDFSQALNYTSHKTSSINSTYKFS